MIKALSEPKTEAPKPETKPKPKPEIRVNKKKLKNLEKILMNSDISFLKKK